MHVSHGPSLRTILTVDFYLSLKLLHSYEFLIFTPHSALTLFSKIHCGLTRTSRGFLINSKRRLSDTLRQTGYDSKTPDNCILYAPSYDHPLNKALASIPGVFGGVIFSIVKLFKSS